VNLDRAWKYGRAPFPEGVEENGWEWFSKKRSRQQRLYRTQRNKAFQAAIAWEAAAPIREAERIRQLEEEARRCQTCGRVREEELRLVTLRASQGTTIIERMCQPCYSRFGFR
jgi:hypothetical protein